MSCEFIPTAVFTHPNVATVGYPEHEARARFGEIRVYRSEFRPLRHTLSASPEKTLMMKAGATKAVFDATIGIHPTAAEEFVTMRTLANS